MYLKVEEPYRFVIDDPAVAVGVAMTNQIALEGVGYGETRVRAWVKGGKKREWVVTVTPPPDGNNDDERVGTFTGGKFFRHVGQLTVGVGEEKGPMPSSWATESTRRWLAARTVPSSRERG